MTLRCGRSSVRGWVSGNLGSGGVKGLLPLSASVCVEYSAFKLFFIGNLLIIAAVSGQVSGVWS